MNEILSSSFTTTFAWTLVHFVWQGLLVAVAFWMLLVALPTRSSNVRYACGLLALFLMAACPVITFVSLHPHENNASGAIAQTSHLSAKFSQTLGNNASQRQSITTREAVDVEHPKRNISDSPSQLFARFAASIRAGGPYLILAWTLGVMLSGIRLLAGFANVIGLRRDRVAVDKGLAIRSRQIGLRLHLATIRVFASPRIRQAAVVGFWRPVVLLPTSWLTSLPPDALEAVIAHELAHIRRHDVWVNLMQRVVETLLFYHPAVWWLSNRIRDERELCCDAIAVGATKRRGAYVMALEQVGKLQTYGNLDPCENLDLATPFMGVRRMNLLNRVNHVLKVPSTPQSEPAWLVGLAATVVPMMALVISGVLVMQQAATAQRREGDAAVEREAERRDAAQGEGRRRSPEAEAGPRRSPEGELRRDAAADNTERLYDGGDALRSFKPQTPREAALLEMVKQLQREVAQLRRDVNLQRDGDFRRTGDRPDRAPRDGDVVRRDDAPRSSSSDRFELSDRWRGTKEGRVFQAYDKNADEMVSLDEWLAMTNGNINQERRELQTRRFNEAEPSGDGKFSPGEFIYWYSKGRFAATEEGSRRGDGDRERRSEGPRDREPERRDGDEREASKSGPRDGEGLKIGPRDRE